jgi:hypothetical protein
MFSGRILHYNTDKNVSSTAAYSCHVLVSFVTIAANLTVSIYNDRQAALVITIIIIALSVK